MAYSHYEMYFCSQYLYMRLLFLFIVCIVASPGLHLDAQSRAISKKDKIVAAKLRKDITYLANDELQGRRTGTNGERRAADYIEDRYRQMDIAPFMGQYKYPFYFTHGREITETSAIVINGNTLQMQDDVFPMPFTNTGHIAADCLPGVMENSLPWILNLYADIAEADDPHFDWERAMYKRSKEAAEHGATAVLFYDGFGSPYQPYFNNLSEYEKVAIPVSFITYAAYKRYVADTAAIDSTNMNVKIDIDIAVKRSERTGLNIAAFIDNKAPYTVILGAHYDHLGLGEDGNSLYTGKEKMVHYGADDNASGTAAILEIASWIRKKKLRRYNYLFVNFSGEELGLLGSKAFIKDGCADSTNVAYMINMDMVGRLNDSTQALYVGGVGTSPAWSNVFGHPKGFRYIVDSSGIGPSDHSSFYHAGIPVLFFFTGTHKDYHKPTDVADKINYDGEVQVLKQVYGVVLTMEKYPKPIFTATKQHR
jgi:aminopeptidase YwaD